MKICLLGQEVWTGWVHLYEWPLCGGRAFLYGPMGRWGYLRAPGWRLLVSVSQGQPSASFLTHRDPSIWSNFLICQELSFTCHRRAFAFASIIVTSWVALPFYCLSWLCLAHRWRGSPRAGQLTKFSVLARHLVTWSVLIRGCQSGVLSSAASSKARELLRGTASFITYPGCYCA